MIALLSHAVSVLFSVVFIILIAAGCGFYCCAIFRTPKSSHRNQQDEDIED